VERRILPDQWLAVIGRTVRGHLASLAEQPELLSAYRGYLKMARQEGFNLPEDLL
jgi:hypothetical protein